LLDYTLATTNAAPPDADLLGTIHTFTASGTPGSPQTIYGWYIMDVSAGKWVYAAYTNRSPPIVIASAGDAYQIQPRFTGGVLATYP
jgi:hypothetical protein